MEPVCGVTLNTLSTEGSDALTAASVYYNALKLVVRENVAGVKA